MHAYFFFSSSLDFFLLLYNINLKEQTGENSAIFIVNEHMVGAIHAINNSSEKGPPFSPLINFDVFR